MTIWEEIEDLIETHHIDFALEYSEAIDWVATFCIRRNIFVQSQDLSREEVLKKVLIKVKEKIVALDYSS